MERCSTIQGRSCRSCTVHALLSEQLQDAAVSGQQRAVTACEKCVELAVRDMPSRGGKVLLHKPRIQLPSYKDAHICSCETFHPQSVVRSVCSLHASYLLEY